MTFEEVLTARSDQHLGALPATVCNRSKENTIERMKAKGNKYNDRIKMIANDLLDEILFKIWDKHTRDSKPSD